VTAFRPINDAAR